MGTPKIQFEKEDLELLADYFFEQFLPLFGGSKDPGIKSGTIIEFSKRMKNKIGLAMLFENKIRLSLNYFSANTQFLPYTVYHEMTHLWLYHLGFDPGHTSRFYQKMLEFNQTGYRIDPEVHVHSRLAAEGSYVYICKNCENRWHLREELEHDIYCALCFKKHGVEHYANLAIDYKPAITAIWAVPPVKDLNECA
jgi:predicted SprT family Zn-dependent metalloprotease